MMTTSQLIQVLCQMDPNTSVLLSLDGFPPKKKVPLHACCDDFKDGKRRVVLTTKPRKNRR